MLDNRETASIRKLAKSLDSQFEVLGFRFGWDGILGLIPGVGDIVTSFFSVAIMAKAAALGAPASVLARMGLNILVDNVFDAVPLIGHIFDFFWKSNNKNIALLDSYLQNPRKTKRSSTIVLVIVFTVFFALLIGLLVFSIWAAVWLIGVLSQSFSAGANL